MVARGRSKAGTAVVLVLAITALVWQRQRTSTPNRDVATTDTTNRPTTTRLVTTTSVPFVRASPSSVRSTAANGTVTTAAVATTSARQPTVVPTVPSSHAGRARVAMAVDHYPTTLVPHDLPRFLRFQVWCLRYDLGLGCDVTGTLYSRVNESDPWEASPIVDTKSELLGTGTWSADLPGDQDAAPSVSYYAEFVEKATGDVVTLPDDGADGPFVSGRLDVSTPIVEMDELPSGPAQTPIMHFGLGAEAGEVGLDEGKFHLGASVLAADGNDVWIVDIVNDRLIKVDAQNQLSHLEVPGLWRMAGGVQDAVIVGSHIYMTVELHRDGGLLLRVDLTQNGAPPEVFGETPIHIDGARTPEPARVVADPNGNGVWGFAAETWMHIDLTGAVVARAPSKPSSIGPLRALHILGGGMAVALPDNRAWILQNAVPQQLPEACGLQVLAPLDDGALAICSGGFTNQKQRSLRLVVLGTDGSSSAGPLTTLVVDADERGREGGLVAASIGTSAVFALLPSATGVELFRVPLADLTKTASD